jgi:hypothetical protein
MLSLNSYSQYYKEHHVAPAPWRYFNDANELIVATESLSDVTVTVKSSDGKFITDFTVRKGTPKVYRFVGDPTEKGKGYYETNKIISGAGLNITATAPVSVNMRNVASDEIRNTNGGSSTGDADKNYIKGNASLTSFGDAGVGVSFRVGYYRDGDLGDFGNYGYKKPIYVVMAISNSTTLSINGRNITTLNKGESYLFESAIGSLVETSNPVVVNTSQN